jgi:hypothetical protein
MTDTPEAAGQCNEARASRGPIVAESWTESGSSGRLSVGEGMAITTSAVAAVSIEGGRPILTRPDPSLPNGMRGVVVEVRGARPRAHRREFTAVGSSGVVLPQPAQDDGTLAYRAPVRRWLGSQDERSGACQIVAKGMQGLVLQGGAVATHVIARTGLPGRPFFSCADVSYLVGESRIYASVLLDAVRPGTPPGALPNMQAVPGHPDVFTAPGIAGELAARRLRDAWLIVQGGMGLRERLVLLDHLHVSVGSIR